MTALALFESAKAALAEALRVDEVMSVRDAAERIRLYGRQAKDRRIIADASALQLRAERKLGQLLINAKETGELGIGRPEKSNLGRAPDPENGSDGEPFQRVTLKDVGIDKKLSMNAQRWARLGDEDFEAKLQAVRDKIEGGGAVVVNPLKDLTTSEKKAARQEREATLGKKQQALPEAKFGVIYADPEWKFEPYSEAGLDRAADNHYPTTTLDGIKARDVGSLAADDCVLFLWATVPMLDQAIEVLKAWGFAYKSNFDWRKDRIGTGFWNRNRHEHLLIGTRGNVPAPAMGDQFDSSIEAAVGEHSAKPVVFYEIIESYFPTLPKIELNARVKREGWARWGYEAPEELTTAEIVGAVDDGMRDGLKGSGVEEQVSQAVGGMLVEALEGKPNAKPFRFTPADDGVLRHGYALPIAEFDLQIVADTIGCTKAQARKRAGHLKLGSRERQRAKASAYTAGQHARGEI